MVFQRRLKESVKDGVSEENKIKLKLWCWRLF